MNEIISLLERAQEKALVKLPVTAYREDDAADLTYNAVAVLGLQYLKQTIFIFRHARKLKQKLEADARPSALDLVGEALRYPSRDPKVPPVEREK